ncbi:uncharacterized protein [Coffea arabica]|uniref:RNase H type-1 domain-containing protein n=1 Tax=Coffea arabica TaxID=13443 RepID=A0A6P6W2Y7_COFAR|nr:uncharacterized protein LOC113729155 [Coffea arabica]
MEDDNKALEAIPTVDEVQQVVFEMDGESSPRPGGFTNGCFKGNLGLAGGRGVLWDSDGSFLLAFSAFFGEMTSLEAEGLTVLQGVKLCFQRGFSQDLVQSDSKVLIAILQHRSKCPWSIRREISQIWHLLSAASCFSHCLREANKVVDILSNVGCSYD